MPVSDALDSVFHEAGTEWNVDPKLLKAIAQAESGGKTSARSIAGARGLMQIMPDTGRGLGMTNLDDPVQSIWGGAKYMAQALGAEKTPEDALRYYHGGPNWRSPGKYGPESQAYAPRVTAAYAQAGSGATAVAKAKTDAPKADATDDFLSGKTLAAPAPTAATSAPAAATGPDDTDHFLSGRGANVAPAAPAAPSTPDDEDTGAGLTPAQLASGKDAYGHPFQSMGATPPGDVVGQSTGKPIAEGQLPGVGTQAIISLPTDPEQRRRVAAAQLFPDVPPKEAQSRVFYWSPPGAAAADGSDRRLAAMGPDGKAYFVDPEAPSRTRTAWQTPGNLTANVAQMAGPALPAVGGFVGGMMAAPTSFVAAPVMAAAGAAAGDATRQGLAMHFDPQSTPYNLAQTAKEAAGAAGGQWIGGQFARFMSPNPLGINRLDLSRLRAVMPEANEADALARSQGVTLSPGQATGLPSLIAHEDAITSGTAGPELSDAANAFYRGQRNDLATAGQRMMERISPAADKTDAAMQFQQGAEDATRITRQSANAAARPSYEAAQRGGTVMSPDLAQLAETPAMQGALARARVEYQNMYRRAAPDSPDFALWDLAKRQLDDGVGVARRAGENTTAMSLDSVRRDLLTHLDTAYPSYATARETAAPGLRLAARLDDSVGSAGGDASERARAIVRPVFESNNPRAVAEARDAFIAAGRGDEWHAGVRSYIQDAFDQASKSREGLNPATLRQQIWGKVDNRDNIRAALGDDAYHGFDNFMQTVERAARSHPMNSLTAPRGAAADALRTAAGDTPGVKAVNAAGSLLDPFRLVQVGSAATDKLAKWMTSRNLSNISERLFSPEGMMYLRSMNGLSPGSQRAITATSEFLGQTEARSSAVSSGSGGNRLAIGLVRGQSR